MADPWDPPSAPAAALIRRVSEVVLAQPSDLIEELARSVLDAAPVPVRLEPTLVAEISASAQTNMAHWVSHTLQAPGGRVPVRLAPELLGIAREVYQRGTEQTLFTTYHAGQNVAWRFWMDVAFDLSSDPEVLREALAAAGHSMFAYVDDTVAALIEHLEQERTELTQGTHAQRFETVSRILAGAQLGTARAGAQLGYHLDQQHLGVVLWTDDHQADQAELSRVAAALTRSLGARQSLSVMASASSLWTWLGGTRHHDRHHLDALVEQADGVRLATGPPAAGLDGFRRTHLDAVVTQRLMFQMPPTLRAATFDDVQLVALATHDRERAAEFVGRVLGPLADASPDLRETLRIYIREQYSASRAARALFAHRNTVLNRLHRAQELLPEPLEDRGLEVGVALEVAHWLGTS